MRRSIIMAVVGVTLLCSPVNAERWMKTFNQKLGGPNITSEDIDTMAKFDTLIMNRRFYYDVNRDTWSALKNVNRNIKILIYLLGGDNYSHYSCRDAFYNNLVARWDVPDLYGSGPENYGPDHSAGKINSAKNEHLILYQNYDASDACTAGKYDEGNSHGYFMDFGYGRWPSETRITWAEYLSEAANTDIASQAWAADGIYLDNCASTNQFRENNGKYTDNNIDGGADSWSQHMNWFLDQVKQHFNAFENPQLLGANRGKTGTSDGVNAWADIDDSDNYPNKPDHLLEEGAFFHGWQNGSDISWRSESEFVNTLKTLKDTTNSQVLLQSQAHIDTDGTAKDQFGNTVQFWDAVWFNLASYALGMHSNSYIGFDGRDLGYKEATDWWFEEYDYMDEGQNLNLGGGLGNYHVTKYGGYNVYWRAFQKGYVFVNPHNVDVKGISLPVTCKRLTHNNFKDSLGTIPSVSSIDLDRHTGAILRKATNPSKFSPPNNLIIIGSK